MLMLAATFALARRRTPCLAIPTHILVTMLGLRCQPPGFPLPSSHIHILCQPNLCRAHSSPKTQPKAKVSSPWLLKQHTHPSIHPKLQTPRLLARCPTQKTLSQGKSQQRHSMTLKALLSPFPNLHRAPFPTTCHVRTSAPQFLC